MNRCMIVDFAVHSPDKEDDDSFNPPRMMCPIRPIEPDGKWGNKKSDSFILSKTMGSICSRLQMLPIFLFHQSCKSTPMEV